MNNVKLSFGEVYVIEKAKKVKFVRIEGSTEERLWYVHANFCGLVRHQSLSGSKYIVSLNDAFSKKT